MYLAYDLLPARNMSRKMVQQCRVMGSNQHCAGGYMQAKWWFNSPVPLTPAWWTSSLLLQSLFMHLCIYLFEKKATERERPVIGGGGMDLRENLPSARSVSKCPSNSQGWMDKAEARTTSSIWAAGAHWVQVSKWSGHHSLPPRYIFRKLYHKGWVREAGTCGTGSLIQNAGLPNSNFTSCIIMPTPLLFSSNNLMGVILVHYFITWKQQKEEVSCQTLISPILTMRKNAYASISPSSPIASFPSVFPTPCYSTYGGRPMGGEVWSELEEGGERQARRSRYSSSFHSQAILAESIIKQKQSY